MIEDLSKPINKGNLSAAANKLKEVLNPTLFKGTCKLFILNTDITSTAKVGIFIQGTYTNEISEGIINFDGYFTTGASALNTIYYGLNQGSVLIEKLSYQFVENQLQILVVTHYPAYINILAKVFLYDNFDNKNHCTSIVSGESWPGDNIPEESFSGANFNFTIKDKDNQDQHITINTNGTVIDSVYTSYEANQLAEDVEVNITNLNEGVDQELISGKGSFTKGGDININLQVNKDTLDELIDTHRFVDMSLAPKVSRTIVQYIGPTNSDYVKGYFYQYTPTNFTVDKDWEVEDNENWTYDTSAFITGQAIADYNIQLDYLISSGELKFELVPEDPWTSVSDNSIFIISLNNVELTQLSYSDIKDIFKIHIRLLYLSLQNNTLILTLTVSEGAETWKQKNVQPMVKVGNPIVFKGTKTWQELLDIKEAHTAETGDMYVVSDKSYQEYYWDGDKNDWEFLGDIFDPYTEGDGISITSAHDISVKYDNDTIKKNSSGNLYVSDSIFPVGTIQMYAGSTAPSGWLLCNGNEIPVTLETGSASDNDFITYFQGHPSYWKIPADNEYRNLILLINGIYTDSYAITQTKKVRLPNLSGNFPLGVGTNHALGTKGGSETVTLTQELMPVHNHGLDIDDGSGSTVKNPHIQYTTSDTNGTNNGIFTNNSGGYNGTTQPHNNMPPYLTVNFIIKY